VPFPFDAVLFDLDGTLLATDRYWIPAARVGARRAFGELGLERALPSAEEWMELVGLPIEEGFEALFPDLDAQQVALVIRRCIEEEHFALAAGAAVLLPGVRDVLVELRARGVRLGIASNCSEAYLDAAMNGVGLGALVDEGRCLDSPGIRNKTDMLRDLLATFGTRSAVMVGDRAADRDAAHANGLPHVHLSSGFAPASEEVACEAVIEDFLELLPRLERRNAWIAAALDELGFHGGERPCSLGVTGRPGAGKTLFARDAARLLAVDGRAVRTVALDDFRRPAAPASRLAGGVGLAPEEHVTAVYDVEQLVGALLRPHARGEAVRLARPAHAIEVPAGALLVVEGPFLLHPRLRSQLDRVIQLELDEELRLTRLAARAQPGGPHDGADRAFDHRFDPAARASLVLAAGNPLGPP